VTFNLKDFPVQALAPYNLSAQHPDDFIVDLLVHHERIEAWILEQAGVSFNPKAEPGKLRVVASWYDLRYHHGTTLLHRLAGPGTADSMAG